MHEPVVDRVTRRQTSKRGELRREYRGRSGDMLQTGHGHPGRLPPSPDARRPAEMRRARGTSGMGGGPRPRHRRGQGATGKPQSPAARGRHSRPDQRPTTASRPRDTTPRDIVDRREKSPGTAMAARLLRRRESQCRSRQRLPLKERRPVRALGIPRTKTGEVPEALVPDVLGLTAGSASEGPPTRRTWESAPGAATGRTSPAAAAGVVSLKGYACHS